MYVDRLSFPLSGKVSPDGESGDNRQEEAQTASVKLFQLKVVAKDAGMGWARTVWPPWSIYLRGIRA